MSVHNVTSAGSGMFNVDGKSMDIQTMFFTIAAERSELIQQQMVDQANAMKSNNAKINTANRILSTLRSSSAEYSKDGVRSEQLFDASTEKLTGDMTYKEWMEKEGIPTGGKGNDWKWAKGGGDGNPDDYAVVLENVKGYIDSLNSNSQLEMIRMQGLVQKHNQNFDMLSNLINKFGQTANTVIGNLR